MTPTEYPETSPDTGHSHDQGPSLPSATQQEQPAASSSNIADETQSFTSHATENNGKDERHADNVQAQTELCSSGLPCRITGVPRKYNGICP